MNRDRSIVTQAMMKSILPHYPAEEWEQLTKEALRIHDSMVPSDAGGKNSSVAVARYKQGVEAPGFQVEQVKDWEDNVSVKLSGGQLGAGTWVKFYREDMSDARQLDKGHVIDCTLKEGKKMGLYFGSKIRAVNPPTMAEIAIGGEDDIPF
tara:strand:- start:79 stop:531 length:453 start_codon:yes stop_codon:yes gene_type:complete